ncbi:MAG: hypothetical protein IPM16_09840 [Chloroflexi bacterium]|nr:hypothetical protein [Chloroflexota bacterium]
MRSIAAVLLIAALLVGCQPANNASPLPTIMALPSATETVPPSDTPPPSATFTPSPTPTGPTPDVTLVAQATVTSTETPEPTETPTETPSETPTETPSSDAAATATSNATATQTFTPSLTVTPSLTITDTPTRTPTPTPWPTEPQGPLLALAILALSSTPAPPVTLVLATATGFVPPNPNTTLCLPPPGGFAAVYAADPVLASQIGCSVGGPLSYPAAVQRFERGMMIYVGESPAAVYVLYNTGNFSHYNDTWVDGVDPVSGGEIPPPGLFEPIRGFGKVWRSFPDVRNGLGWAIENEAGTSATVLAFNAGKMIALPNLGQVAVLANFGNYRLLPGTS